MLSINNVEMPTPSGYSANIMDIVDAERDSKATMHIDFIAKKWKLEVTWSVLKQADMTKVLNALENNTTFNVSFINPNTGSPTTAIFYKGDRSVTMLSFINGVAIWKDFKINLIEV
jgi:hypothetical protein